MTVHRRLPEWFKVPMPGGPNYLRLREQFRSEQLHTVCEEAHCPNIGDCWERGTATFMILGDICTRACAYCAVTSGVPQGLDLEEPTRLAETVERLGLRYAVITSVNRDDLPDGGAFIFAQCVVQIRKRTPDCKIETLIPDFEGNWDALDTMIAARPDTLNHNIETVRRVFRRVRPRGDYDQSLELLRRVKQHDRESVTKSGMMIGLGETWDEVMETMEDPEVSRLRPAHHRPVPAAVSETRESGQVVHAGRVRRPEAGGRKAGIPPRGVRPSGQELLSRRRAARRRFRRGGVG